MSSASRPLTDGWPLCFSHFVGPEDAQAQSREVGIRCTAGACMATAALDWVPSFADGSPNVSWVGHLSFVDRRREGPLHLRHRSLDRCGQLMARERLHPFALADGARPFSDIRALELAISTLSLSNAFALGNALAIAEQLAAMTDEWPESLAPAPQLTSKRKTVPAM